MIVDDLFENVAGPEKCWPGYRKVGTKPGTGRNAGKRVNDCEKIKESTGELRIGDPVIITGNVQFQGKTGDVRDFNQDGSFVVVDLYNYGPRSFHASDVSRNDYADSEDAEDVAEGEQQVYKVVALDKGNALKKPTKLKVKADSIEDLFDRLAANDWYPLEINGVEVINGKRLKQGVAEGEGGFDIEDMVMDQYRNGNDVWEIAQYLGIGEDEVQDIIDSNEQGVAEGTVNELSKDTLKAYAKKAVPDMQASQKRSEIEAGKAASTKDDETAKTHYDAAKQAKDRTEKRMAGISGAIKRVTKQDVAEGGVMKSIQRGLKGWQGSSHLTDIQDYIRNASDKTLIRLYKDPGESPYKQTPRDIQIKLINRELKRRYGIKPGEPGVAEGFGKLDTVSDRAFDAFMNYQTATDPAARKKFATEFNRYNKILKKPKNWWFAKAGIELGNKDLPVNETGVSEADAEKIGGRYDPEEFDDMVLRLKTLAGAGPLKTVWDPERRVYRNVPINQSQDKK
jgi:hypothetical protein